MASAGANPSWRQLVQTHLGVSWSKPVLASAGPTPSWRQLVQTRLGVSWSKPLPRVLMIDACFAPASFLLWQVLAALRPPFCYGRCMLRSGRIISLRSYLSLGQYDEQAQPVPPTPDEQAQQLPFHAPPHHALRRSQRDEHVVGGGGTPVTASSNGKRIFASETGRRAGTWDRTNFHLAFPSHRIGSPS